MEKCRWQISRPRCGNEIYNLLRFHGLEFSSMATFKCEAGLGSVPPGNKQTGLERQVQVSTTLP